MIKMVVTDLDGTYLKGDKTVSAYTEKITAELRRRGIPFVIATARPVRAVKTSLPWLKYDAGIFHNGAVMEAPSGEKINIGIERPIKTIHNILNGKPNCHIAAEVNDKLYSNFDAERLWPGSPYTKTESFNEITSFTADKLIIEAQSLEEMADYGKYLDEGLYLSLSEHRAALVLNRKASKMNGILRLAERYGICPDEIAAFGDDYIDIDMLKGCGYGVAVSNALEEVKKIAGYICGSNENDGFAGWIEANMRILG